MENPRQLAVVSARKEGATVKKAILSEEQLGQGRVSYATRRVPRAAMKVLLSGDIRPQAGDLVYARIEQLGQHKRIELETGRRAQLYPGDEVIVSYGNRYAPDQFEAVVPDNLGPCHLVAGGGIAAITLSRHYRMKRPTVIKPLGLIADSDGQRLNLSRWTIADPCGQKERPYTVAVVGSSMNAGKTTTAASLIHGLAACGLKVGAAKVTGTGAGCDRWSMVDAGAAEFLDFTDAGYASTFRLSAAQVEGILVKLVGCLAERAVHMIVLEIADGLLQKETKTLLVSSPFRALVDEVIYAASDAMGALAGVGWLRQKGLPVSALSGILSLSPLATKEALAATGLRVLSRGELCDAAWHLPRRAGGNSLVPRIGGAERHETAALL